MTRDRWSGRVARRASALSACVLLAVGGTLAAGPSALASTPAAATASAVSVAVGLGHSCALTGAGGVVCWGDNSVGQLGDGLSGDSRLPVDVVGLTSGVAQISVSWQTTCAVTVVGAVKCWGAGSLGQLGNGATGDSATPVDVVGLGSGVASVSVGSTSACALTTAGGVTCWGAGEHGGLGDGQSRSSTRPVAVTGLRSGVKAVTTDGEHACALRASGVSCWGLNNTGQLGTGDTTSRSTPVSVPGLGGGITSIDAGGSSTCATRGPDRVLCWGYNPSGRLGVARNELNVLTPRPVKDLTGVSGVVAALGVTCVTGPADLRCWGTNRFGVLGDGTTARHYRPAPVVGLHGPVSSVAVGFLHSCAVELGRVLCWGHNKDGELGDGTRSNSAVPLQVVGLDGP